MRDGINLVKAGHPVVVFVHDHFERAARAQAEGLGVRDMKLYVFPQYVPGRTSVAEEQEKAIKAAEEFQTLLIGDP